MVTLTLFGCAKLTIFSSYVQSGGHRWRLKSHTQLTYALTNVVWFNSVASQTANQTICTSSHRSYFWACRQHAEAGYHWASLKSLGFEHSPGQEEGCIVQMLHRISSTEFSHQERRLSSTEEKWLSRCMSSATLFSTFDLRSSYHQVQVAPQDRDKTTFICPQGMYRYRAMPFRLCNASLTFQRLMDVVMFGLHLDVCLVYLDDIIHRSIPDYQRNWACELCAAKVDKVKTICRSRRQT